MGDLKYPETIIRAAMDDCVLCKGKVPCDHHRPLFEAIDGYRADCELRDDRTRVLERELENVRLAATQQYRALADLLEAAEKETDQ